MKPFKDENRPLGSIMGREVGHCGDGFASAVSFIFVGKSTGIASEMLLFMSWVSMLERSCWLEKSISKSTRLASEMLLFMSWVPLFEGSCWLKKSMLSS